jgi:type IV fimbrial biogenesis protein FimT
MMNKKGFSILELIVVLAILGILLSIATISGSTWLNKYRVESQMKEMYVDLMNARASAMQKNRMHFVELTAARYTVYEDTNDGPDGNGTPETALDTPVMRKDIPSYPIAWNAGGTIIFNTRGLMSGSERSVWVSDSHGSAYNCVKVSATRILMGGWNGTACVTQ